MGIDRWSITLILLFLLFLISFAKADAINNETNTKTIIIAGVTITSPYNTVCEWKDPKSNYKDCSIILAVNNSNSVSFTLNASPFSTRFLYNAANLSISYSMTYSAYNDSILNQTCYNNLPLSQKQYLSTPIPCYYNYTRLNFSNWQPIAGLTTIARNSVYGIKLDFKSPITISNKIYEENHFNFTVAGTTQSVTLDPDISACSVLSTAGATYTLTANIANSTSSTCMNITADNVTLNCQGYFIDGKDTAGSNGIYSTKFNSTIQNCIIVDWASGIQFNTATNGTISNVNDTSNGQGIILLSSNYTSISNSRSYSNQYNGFYIYTVANNNILSNVTAYSNGPSCCAGVYFDNANNNTVANSTFYSNKYGIQMDVYLTASQNNSIYNNLFNNTINFYASKTTSNNLNTTNQTGTRIYGNGTNIGGNYWTNSSGDNYSDTCIDSNADGFCDTAYTLKTNNVDYLPLSKNYSGGQTYTRTCSDYMIFSDTDARNTTLIRSSSDAGIFIDSTSRNTTLIRSSSISFIFVDTTSRNTTLIRSSSDIIIFVDITSRNTTSFRSTSAYLAFIDIALPNSTKFRSASDYLVYVDASSRNITFIRAVSDSGYFIDITKINGEYSRLVSDLLAFQDSTARNTSLYITASDFMVFVDSTAKSIGLSRIAYDSLTFVDSIFRIREVIRMSSDYLIFSDSTNRTIQVQLVNVTYGNNSVTFTCNGTSNQNLTNVSLYITSNGTWLAQQSQNVSGTSAQANFTEALTPGIYTWNCEWCTDSGCNSANQNQTLNYNVPDPTGGGGLMFIGGDLSMIEVIIVALMSAIFAYFSINQKADEWKLTFFVISLLLMYTAIALSIEDLLISNTAVISSVYSSTNNTYTFSYGTVTNTTAQQATLAAMMNPIMWIIYLILAFTLIALIFSTVNFMFNRKRK